MLALSVFASFLIGSIPTGFILAKLKGVDLRTVGSGNTGATNAGRVLGKGIGILTLILDFLKGIVGIKLGMTILGSAATGFSLNPEAPLALAAVCGHCFSPWLKFRGGKGVATGGGVLLYLAPLQTLLALLAFAIVFRLTKIVSISSITAAAVIPLLLLCTDSPQEVKIAALCCAALVIYRHRENIARLIAGTEQKFTVKSG